MSCVRMAKWFPMSFAEDTEEEEEEAGGGEGRQRFWNSFCMSQADVSGAEGMELSQKSKDWS